MSRVTPAIALNSTGYPMIRSISIRNFRCFQQMEIEHCNRFNIIVGDSGSGKTALLEAIFLAMGTSPELASRYRQHRGLPAQFQGSVKYIQEALWEDVFFRGDLSSPVQISLSGKGPECRKLVIYPGDEAHFLPFTEGEIDPEATLEREMYFYWTSATGETHTGIARIEDKGLSVKSTGEDLPDNYYFHSGNQGSGVENAARYSRLSKLRRENEFDKMLKKEFKWINGVSLEVSGGSPLIYVDVDGHDSKIPINSISSGVNKLAMYALAMLNAPDSVMLIDEIENGLYYKRYKNYWRIICGIAEKNNIQLFVTTHSKEFLEAIVGADKSKLESTTLLRLKLTKRGPKLEKFDGHTLQAGIQYDEEIR